MKKILKGFHSGGDKSSKSDDAPPRTGGITFGGAEIVDDGYDEPRQIDISEGTKSNGEQGSSSPGTQKKSPGRVTISLPDEEKSKKVKRAPTKGAPGSDIKKKIQKCKDDKSTRLDLAKMDIAVLPSAIKDVPNLEELYLYGNRLETVPGEIGHLHHLKRLALNTKHTQHLSLIHI